MSRPRLAKGCFGAVVLLLLLIGLAVGFAVYQGGREPKGRPEYVALGSSFAAGAGLGALEAGSPLLCARSVNGYPQQLARRANLSIVDMSCGGAVTPNVVRGGQFFQGPQVRAITPETRLVTITVGGNDIGYVGDLSLLAARRSDGVFGWLVRSFWKGPKTEGQRDYAGLRRDLLATLAAVHARAPEAVVVVATYPTLLPASGTCSTIAMTAAEAAGMREVGDRLAEVTRSAAREGGAVLVDMHALGAGHDACSAEPWTKGWVGAKGAPFHPNADGAEATAAAIQTALRAAG